MYEITVIMASVFRLNKPIEPHIFDFRWEEYETTWFYSWGTTIMVLTTMMILYIMCIVWRFSILRVRPE